MNTKHEFGGLWTRKKLSVLEAYLNFYVTALKNLPFSLHYADAFAGTGTHAPAAEEDQGLLVPYEDFRGSALTALEVSPGFNHFHFNDLNPMHVSELHKIQETYPNKQIHIYEQDVTVPPDSSMPECGKLIISGSLTGEYRGRFFA